MISRNIHHKLLSLAIATTSVCLPTAVYAQTSAALEEVLVTARRREESLQDVPVAVTTFSSKNLEIAGAADISEIANATPSVTLEPSRGTNTTLTAFIRGVGQQDPLAGFEQGVALYLDDVYLARPQGALLDIYDVERIEVLRGPQGTLYGRNAVGGAIKYVTKRLPEEFEASLRHTLGTYNQHDTVATAAGAISEEFLAGVTIASLQRDGFGDNITTGDHNYNKDLMAFRLSAEWLPNDDITVRLAYDQMQDDSAPVAGHRPFPEAFTGGDVLSDVRDTRAGAAQQVSTASISGNNEINAKGYSASIEWAMSEALTLRSITAYREDDTETVIDFDSTASMDFDTPVIYENDQTSQEFQLLYNSDKMSVVTGIYYLDASASNDFDVVLGLLNPAGITAYTGGTVDTKSWSLFGDVTYDLSDKLSLSLGVRYTEDERSADVFRGTYLGFGSLPFGNPNALQLAVTSDYEATRTFSDVSPRINLDYEINDNMNVYVGYSQGWKAGSFDPRGANFATPEVERGFDPETLDSYEAGLKTTWWEGRAITNIAIFSSNYEDMQIPGSVGVDTDNDGVNDSFVGTVTNAGKATISGIEVEAQIAFTEAFSMQMALSRLNADIDEWIFNGVNIASSREVQNTPETMANVAANYHVDVGDGSLDFNASWTYKSEVSQFETPTPILDQDSVSTFAANVLWRSGDEHWTVGLHGKNLTDEDIKTSGYCFGSGGCPSTLGLEDNTTVFYAPPRTVAVSVKYDY